MTEAKQTSGGGSLLIAWQLSNKRVLIVGGGEVASQRIESILVTGATILLVSPAEGIGSRTKELVSKYKESGKIVHIRRKFSETEDLENMDMVLTALDDNELSEKIVHMCRERRIPVNAADIPHLCDFYFGAQIRDGPLQIMISTNGNGPRMAALIRTRLQKGLTGLEGRAIEKVGLLRERLKERAPGVGGIEGRQRMKWMKELCDIWEMEDLAMLEEPTMEFLLNEGWSKDRKVLSPMETMPILRTKKQTVIRHVVTEGGQSTITAFILGAVCAGLFFTYRGR
ncbi:putative NAD(P)-binding-domain-containing protein [Crepidotus variabilis]|uniref:precorrin-2 dehydrogenase n=1 Tax=Crepidotus variabilis TaxID=179855 RepID=A0A9P6JNT9_9AGAR|nr:putative NAD(P)-binding-domain-containing protein [Crepidotus variabilis]